uniref:Fungal lipase-like domain-containing protein n=1 Tax=Acrobeloides nanus TaxID=290746 RepID=A0A914CQC0_9BILA
MASAAYSDAPQLCVKDNFDNSTVTGHSLGAAMASVCAGYISALQYFSPDKIKLVTYGQPRVGDLAYATYIDQTIPYAYRVVHAFDMVPHVPLYGDNIGAIQNYTHHKSEVWYENDMVLGKPYVECDQNEGKNCSDQLEKLGLLDTNVLDHLWYFNVLADYAYFGCKRN